MKFWDTSAIMPLIATEPSTERLRRLALEDRPPFVWWATVVECASAIARKSREGRIGGAALDSVLDGLARLREDWQEIPPTEELRMMAERLLDSHMLRAGDALQLAAALTAAAGDPASVGFVCLDERLSAAARREGFDILP